MKRTLRRLHSVFHSSLSRLTQSFRCSPCSASNQRDHFVAFHLFSYAITSSLATLNQLRNHLVASFTNSISLSVRLSALLQDDRALSSCSNSSFISRKEESPVRPLTGSQIPVLVEQEGKVPIGGESVKESSPNWWRVPASHRH